MKIAFVTPGVFPLPPSNSGSVEIVVHGLADELAEHANVIVFSKHPKGKVSLTKRGHRVDYRIPFISSKQYLSQIIKRIEKEKPSCIQIDNRPLYLLYLKSNLPNATMILSLHSLTFIENLPINDAKLALQTADLILVNSKFIQQELVNRFPEASNKVIVRYIAVSHNIFYDRFSARGEKVRKLWRAKYDIEGKKVMMFIGRLIPEKGLHLILQSLPELLRHVPDAHLLIVGSSHYGRQRFTPYVKMLRKLIQPIAKHVTFTNYISPAIVPQLYPVADVVVTPSIGKEAFCLVNVEAAISGIPVITTDNGGIPEVVTHNESGLIIPTNQWKDKFIEYALSLLQSTELSKTIGAKAQRIALERFTWQQTAKHYYNIYSQLTNPIQSPARVDDSVD